MKPIVLLLAGLLPALLFGCSDPSDNDTVIAVINDYELTEKEFRLRLGEEMRYEDTALTDEVKEEFLKRIIHKELLIQEAIQLGLERKEDFVQAIERYWENTLVRDMMELRGDWIKKTTVVTAREVEDRYARMLEETPGLPPLADIEPAVRQQVFDEKVTRALEDWIASLETMADIEINQQELDKLR